MCKVYAFPTKKQLPKDVEEYLYGLGRNYGATMYNALEELCEDIDTPEEYGEIMELITIAYTKGIIDVLEELED